MEIGDRWICFCHESLVLIIPHRQPTCYLIAPITAFDAYSDTYAADSYFPFVNGRCHF